MVTMPACTSTDVIAPVHDHLELALGASSSGSRSVKDVDSALVASARKALLDSSNQLQFVPARQSYSTVQEVLKEKYTWLGASCQQNQAANTHKEHMGLLNGKDQSKESRGGLDDGIPQPRVVIFNADCIDMKWSTMHPARVGLTNMGNTCFLNSTLQCLVFTPPMANYLLTGGHAQECKVSGFCMLCEMQHLIRKCIGPQASATTVQPLSILQKIKMIAKNMSWGRQEDAHEFLRYVIDAMQKTCQFGYPNLDVHSKQTTVVSQIFGGYLRSQVRCLQCKTPSDTYDPFLDISIDIKNANSVERALQKFVQPEILDVDNAYHCIKCSEKVRAQKRFTIHRVPKVLTIQLKRFDYHRQVGGKVSKHVEFTEKLNLRPFTSKHEGEALVYQLYAVLVHSGHSCNSGHYYCYVRAPNRSWYCMNDSSVTQASLARVLAAEAYILFYARTHQTSLPSKPLQQQSAAVPSAALSSPVMAGGGGAAAATNSALPVGSRSAPGPTAAAKPSFLANMASCSSETSSTKCVNGPRTLDGAPLSNKITFSLSGAHNGTSDRPRIILHNPKKSLTSLSAQPLGLQPGAVKQHAIDATSSIAVGSSQKQSRPLVPYNDEEDIPTPAASKEPQSTTSSATASSATAQMSQLSVVPSRGSSTAAATGPRHGTQTSSRDSTSSSSSSMVGDRERKSSSSSATLSGSLWQHDAAPTSGSSGSSSTSLSAAARPTVNATAPNWHVVDNASVRPSSVRSEHSSASGSGTSVNSTQEWSVQLKDDAGCCRLPTPPRQQPSPLGRSGGCLHTPAAAPGWHVTADLAGMPEALSSATASTVKRASSQEAVAQSPALCAGCSDGSSADNGAHTSSRDKLPRPSVLSPLRGGCEDARGCSGKTVATADAHLSKAVGRANSASRVDVAAVAAAAAGGTGCEDGDSSLCKGAGHGRGSSSLSDSTDQRRLSDSLSKSHDERTDESRKRKKHKKHKRTSETEAADQDVGHRAHIAACVQQQQGGNDGTGTDDDGRKSCRQSEALPGIAANALQRASDEHRRKKKHKRRRRRRSNDSSSSEQWVEITKANLADKKLLGQGTTNGHIPTAVAGGGNSLAANMHRAHNGSGDQGASGSSRLSVGSASEVKQAPKWDGTKKSSVTHLLERHSLASYGASVSSWDGSKSQLNREAEEERKLSRKRTWHDEYEDELDRGRIKKMKNNSEKRDYSPDHNKLQRLQDIRNHTSGKADKWRHDQTAAKSGSRTVAY